MTFPASRLTDLHLCPSFNGVIPHIGGPVQPPGATTVFINGLPAARVTDPALCVGVIDSISTGAGTVMAMGLPVAHLTSRSLHGGIVVMGSLNVLVGGKSAEFRFALTGTQAEVGQLQEGLGLLYSTPSGRELIARLAASGQTVTISVTTGGSDATPASADPGGKDTSVRWNPSQRVEGLPAGDPRGGAVVLGHELCHALHNAEDTQGGGPHEQHPGQVGTSDRAEERQTVGSAPPYDANGHPVSDASGNPAGTHTRRPDGTFEAGPDHGHDVPTENAIRDDFGFPRRPTYYPSNWPGGAPW
jgi:uncharacterized Zn-binding protein involved in type VI secretion